jgi:predicted alpha-1,6-mannanase (GH76 family)
MYHHKHSSYGPLKSMHHCLPVVVLALVAQLMLVAVASASPVRAPPPLDPDAIFAAYTRAFVLSPTPLGGDTAYFRRRENGTEPWDRAAQPFWKIAEQIEMVADAAERAPGNAAYARLALQLVAGFTQLYAEDWTYNKFNDDITWMVIASARVAAVTGNRKLVDLAVANFERMYARASDSVGGGGLWWNTDKQQKNTCVTAPAAIAAALLFEATGDALYLTRAEALYRWVNDTLVSAAGKVGDHVDYPSGHSDWSTYTYNAGVFVGAATKLHLHTGHADYLSDASRAVAYARANLAGQHAPGIVTDEFNGEGDDDSDGPGFKGVMVRWIALYAAHAKRADIADWLRANLESACAFRNSRGLQWGQWWRTAYPGGDAWLVSSWAASTAVVLSQCVQ